MSNTVSMIGAERMLGSRTMDGNGFVMLRCAKNAKQI